MTSTFWINKPSILLNKNQITEIWPTENLSKAGKYNSITRLVILLTFLAYFIKKSKQILCIGFIVILSIALLYKYQNKEGFQANDILYETIKQRYQQPSEANPMSNVMIGDDQKRKSAPPAYLQVVENEINDKTKNMISKNLDETKEKLFKDLGENINFEHSMRSWYSTPSTEIPNNQNEFMEFCYADMASHKNKIKDQE